MKDIIRDSTVGQLLRLITRNKILQYPEESPGFRCPKCYGSEKQTLEDSVPRPSSPTDISFNTTGRSNISPGTEETVDAPEPNKEESTAADLNEDEESDADVERGETDKPGGPLGLWKIPTQFEMQRRYSTAGVTERSVSRPIVAQKTVDGTVLVDWYTTDDPENPQNWSAGKKGFVSLQICMYSFAVYVGSSIYAPVTELVMHDFGIGAVPGVLPLAIYVLAYGIGPMLFSPLSEIPALGRNPIYNLTFTIFIILCFPISYVDNFAGLLVLRFLSGFFGSPCLATGAATFQDMYSMLKMPYLIAFWAMSVTLGPAIAPIVAGFSVGVKGWHWFSWELLWLSAPVWITMLISMPETSSANILLRRAQRLRKATGKTNLKSQSEIDQAGMSSNAIAYDALIKPWEINALDPAVAFTTVYTALIYGIFYSFFESFPLVYPVIYGFNLGESTLPFLSVIAALVIVVPAYCAYYYYIVEPRVKKAGFGAPEGRLVPGLLATFFVPAGLFLFAWTSKSSIHWTVPTTGAFLTMAGCYIIVQALFLYLPFTYPQYAASLFAANDFARSSFAAGCIVFSGPMFRNLGLAKGCTLLAGLTVGCTVCLYVLYFFGASLRKRSRFAVK